MSITLLSLGFHIVIPAGVFKYHSGVSFEAGSMGGKMLFKNDSIGLGVSNLSILLIIVTGYRNSDLKYIGTNF